jgi:hypothetical protein
MRPMWTHLCCSENVNCIVVLQSFVSKYSRYLKTTTTASTLATGRITRNRSNIFNSTNLESISGQGPESRLCPRSWRLGLVSASPSDLDVKGRQSQFLASDRNVLGGKHRRVWGGLIAIGLDLHASGNAHHGFSSREVGDVNKGIVEGGKDAGNAKDFFAFLADWQVGNCVGFTMEVDRQK